MTGQILEMAMAWYYVYILLLNNKQLYTGYTSDLHRRMPEHQAGNVASTRNRRPLELIHCESYAVESDARRRERFSKTTEGRRLLRQQLRDILTLRGVITDSSSQG